MVNLCVSCEIRNDILSSSRSLYFVLNSFRDVKVNMACSDVCRYQIPMNTTVVKHCVCVNVPAVYKSLRCDNLWLFCRNAVVIVIITNRLNYDNNKMQLNTPTFHSELQFEFCEKKVTN
jgi:hypothetical protein